MPSRTRLQWEDKIVLYFTHTITHARPYNSSIASTLHTTSSSPDTIAFTGANSPTNTDALSATFTCAYVRTIPDSDAVAVDPSIICAVSAA